MAHQIDMSNGRANMAWAEGTETPWHGLGFTVPSDATVDQWQEIAGLNWSAMLADVQYKDLFGEMCTYPGSRIVLRSDTQAALGMVSDKYKPVQPKQVLEFFRDLVGDFGGFRMETAGSLAGGRKIWALAKATDEIDAGGGDRLLRYLMLATSFDLSTPTIVQHTSARVVCANTHALALGMNEPRISVRHDTDFHPEMVKQQMLLDKDWKAYAEYVKGMVARKVTEDESLGFFADVLYPESVRDNSTFDHEAGQRQIERLMLCLQNGRGQDTDTAKGTAWGLMNAVTYFADHVGGARAMDKEAKLDKAWFGDNAAMKDRALEHAIAMSV